MIQIVVLGLLATTAFSANLQGLNLGLSRGVYHSGPVEVSYGQNLGGLSGWSSGAVQSQAVPISVSTIQSQAAPALSLGGVSSYSSQAAPALNLGGISSYSSQAAPALSLGGISSYSSQAVPALNLGGISTYSSQAAPALSLGGISTIQTQAAPAVTLSGATTGAVQNVYAEHAQVTPGKEIIYKVRTPPVVRKQKVLVAKVQPKVEYVNTPAKQITQVVRSAEPVKVIKNTQYQKEPGQTSDNIQLAPVTVRNIDINLKSQSNRANLGPLSAFAGSSYLNLEGLLTERANKDALYNAAAFAQLTGAGAQNVNQGAVLAVPAVYASQGVSSGSSHNNIKLIENPNKASSHHGGLSGGVQIVEVQGAQQLGGVQQLGGLQGLSGLGGGVQVVEVQGAQQLGGLQGLSGLQGLGGGVQVVEVQGAQQLGGLQGLSGLQSLGGGVQVVEVQGAQQLGGHQVLHGLSGHHANNQHVQVVDSVKAASENKETKVQG